MTVKEAIRESPVIEHTCDREYPQNQFSNQHEIPNFELKMYKMYKQISNF